MRIEYNGEKTESGLKKFAEVESVKNPNKYILAVTVFSDGYISVMDRPPSFRDIDLYLFNGYWLNGKFTEWQKRKVIRYNNYLLTTKD